jgi:predicted aconitase
MQQNHEVALTESDLAMLAGDAGSAVAFAMRVVVGMAIASEAGSLLDVSRAHIDGCLYHGQAGLDFARRLADGGARVVIPTTLNVSSLDLLHPDLYRGPTEEADAARALMTAYEEMGCRPTWTCAPYQLSDRPGFGEHIAWAESNAIVFANSVLGARTDRYGDFIDIAAAITGRAPAAGFHLDENRRAGVVYDVGDLFDPSDRSDAFFAILGHLLGRRCGTSVPAVEGIDAATEDQLKAMCAAGASSGALALIHVIGVTPEAPDRAAAGVTADTPVVRVDQDMLAAARTELSTADADAPIGTVSLGTPHYSIDQLVTVDLLFGGRLVHDTLVCYVNTNRAALEHAGQLGIVARLEEAGVKLVVDTCTYVTAILDDRPGIAMTDSAKWAFYAPGNLGIDVVFATMAECVESAVAGRAVFDGPR